MPANLRAALDRLAATHGYKPVAQVLAENAWRTKDTTKVWWWCRDR